MLSSHDCYTIVKNALGAVDVIMMQGESGLVVNDARYYVYIIAQVDGKALGQIAINENDGALYYYEGEGKLSNYSKMTDRLREMELQNQAVPLWSGSYADGIHSLEITYQTGESQLTFVLDGEEGTAVVIDHQAVSLDNTIKFVYQEDGSIVTTGAVEAVFIFGAHAIVPETPAQPQAPAVDTQTPVVDSETPTTDAETPTIDTETPAEGETPTVDGDQTTADEQTDSAEEPPTEEPQVNQPTEEESATVEGETPTTADEQPLA